MRKLLLALSACVLCAAPLKAQSADAAASAPTPATAVVSDEPRTAPAPSLYPTTDEVRQQVARMERQRAQGQKAVLPNDFLYLVAAIVVGVVIAAVVLD